MKMSKKNKKGVSLVYVIMASAVLMILSGALTASASHNIDLTARSTEGRQAYITAKSAMEYAKGVVNKQYESAQAKLTADSSLTADKLCNSLPDGFNDFSVKPDSAAAAGLAQVTPAVDPDGVNKYAKCAISLRYPSDLTKYTYDVQITVKVLYNSGFSKTLSYTGSYTLTSGASGSSKGFPYLLCGGKYGYKNLIFSNASGKDPTFNNHDRSGIGNKPNGSSMYPVLINCPVKLESGTVGDRHLTAPQVYFMAEDYPGESGPDSNTAKRYSCIYADDNSTNTTICSNFIYIASSSIRGIRHDSSTPATTNYIGIRNYTDNNSAPDGIIYFAKDCSIQYQSDSGVPYVVKTIPKGYYSFKNSDQINLFDSGKLSDLVEITDPAKVAKIASDNQVQYVSYMHQHMITGDGGSDAYQYAHWCDHGNLQDYANPVPQTDNYVYLYVERNNSISVGAAPNWNLWGRNNPVYQAKSITLNYVTNADAEAPGSGTAENCPFCISGCVTFKVNGTDEEKTKYGANTISLSGQETDGVGTASDKLVFKQQDATSQLIFSSTDSTVTVILQHALKVEHADPADKDKDYTLESGTYTCPSGTNIFSHGAQYKFTKVGDSGGWDGGDMG